jgi:hypothetical protein
VAIGDRDEQATINISANSVSSSLLPLCRRTIELEPSVAYVHNETVVVRRLDSFLPELCDAQRIFLKIDTQGFERKVVEGSHAILNRVAMIQMELAWTPSYEGQSELGVMVDHMRELGFEPAMVAPAWINEITGLMPEIDVVFVRRETSS